MPSEVAVLNAHDHDTDGEQQVEPGALREKPPQSFHNKTIAKDEDEAGDNRG